MTQSSGVLDAPLTSRASAAEISSLMQRARLRSMVFNIGQERVWDSELTPDIAEDFVERLGAFIYSGSQLAIDAFAFSCTMVIGGCEPFANLDALVRVGAAGKRQLFYVQSQVWGRWTAPEDLPNAIATVKGSLDLLAISVSARDMRRNGVQHVASMIDAARANEINVCIYLILDDGNDWPPEFLGLRQINEETIIINTVPMYGNAPSRDNEASGLLLTEIPKLFRCRERFGFYIDPHCDVYPCSAMVGRREFRVGNIVEDEIETIVGTLLGRPDLARLSDEGPHYLRTGAEAAGVGGRLPSHFVDACDFHRQFVSIEALQETATGLTHQSRPESDPS